MRLAVTSPIACALRRHHFPLEHMATRPDRTCRAMCQRGRPKCSSAAASIHAAARLTASGIPTSTARMPTATTCRQLHLHVRDSPVLAPFEATSDPTIAGGRHRCLHSWPPGLYHVRGQGARVCPGLMRPASLRDLIAHRSARASYPGAGAGRRRGSGSDRAARRRHAADVLGQVTI